MATRKVHTVDEDDDHTPEASRDTHDRLAAVKAAYDPDNLSRTAPYVAPSDR